MLKKYLVFNLVYALGFLFIAYSTAFLHQPKITAAALAASFFILPLFFVVVTKLKGRFHRRIFIGLICAFAGSIFYLQSSGHPQYQQYAALAALISMVYTIRAFYLDFRSAPELDKSGAKIAIISSFVAFTGFYFYLRPHLPVMKLPVLICIFISALLLMMAAFRNKRVNKISFRLVITGVILLVMAHAFLAQVYFIGTFKYAETLIPLIYLAAQYLIIIGAAERKLLHTETAL